MKLFVSSIVFLTSVFANGATLLIDNDWRAFKDESTRLGEIACGSETIAFDEVGNAWKLQVLKLKSTNGDYSFPVIISFPEAIATPGFVKAEGRSNSEVSPTFEMALLQPNSLDRSVVAVLARDRIRVVRQIKAYADFFVDFVTPSGDTAAMSFSLKGSTAAINEVEQACP